MGVIGAGFDDEGFTAASELETTRERRSFSYLAVSPDFSLDRPVKYLGRTGGIMLSASL